MVINLMNDPNAGNLFECRVDNFQFTSKRKIRQFIYRCDKIEEKTNSNSMIDFLSLHIIHVFLSLVQVWLCRIPWDVYEKMIRDTGNGIHFGHIYITGCQRSNINTTNFDTFHLLCQLPYAAKSNSHFNLFGCMPKRFGHSIWKP